MQNYEHVFMLVCISFSCIAMNLEQKIRLQAIGLYDVTNLELKRGEAITVEYIKDPRENNSEFKPPTNLDLVGSRGKNYCK